MSDSINTHFGDPCIHCALAHDSVPIGPCKGDSDKAIPVAWRSLGVRWDGVEEYLIRMSNGTIRRRWEHISFHLAADLNAANAKYDATLGVTP